MFHGIEFDPGYHRLALDLSFISGESKITQKPVDPEDPYQAPHRDYSIKPLKPRKSTGGMQSIFRIVFRPLEMGFCSSRREEKKRNPL